MALNRTDGQIVAGVQIDEHRFVGRMKAAQLFQLTIDPRRTEERKGIDGDTQIQSVRRMRMEVQRLFEGAKAKNVESYARYIVNVHDGAEGMTPPIILYTERILPTEEVTPGETSAIQIPWGTQLVAIDGETQLAARFEAASIKQETAEDFVSVVICHGHTTQWARQVFHDLNMLGVRPSAALGLSMDERDPLTQVAREIADTIPFYKGRVNKTRRQLRASDKEVVTFAALRVACVTFAEGIGGLKYGAKPVPIDVSRVPGIKRAANEWFTAVANTIGPALENPRQCVASSSSVMAAIGALGHVLVEINDDPERARNCARLANELASVRWEKGQAWEGIAGKFTPKGAFSISGAKDAGYGVYSALSDRTSKGYQRIRQNATEEVDSGSESDEVVDVADDAQQLETAAV
jgi:DGQHR domain-containing protein